MTVTPLHRALASYGRKARRLAPDTVLAADYLLEALAGPEAIANDADHIALANWTCDQLEHIIAAFPDYIDHRLAETILAACREFHGAPVNERRNYLRSHGEGYVESAFKRRHQPVLARMATELEQAYRNKCAPHVFFAGRYLDEQRQEVIARALGEALSALAITLVCGGSRVGAHTSHAMARGLQANGTYAPGRTTMYVRTESTRLTDLYQPLGKIIHLDTGRTETRRIMLQNIQACLVFAGGDFGDADGNGTAEEVAIARELSIPIIPIAASGGTAEHTWQLIRPSISDTDLAHDFDDLHNPDTTIVIAAVIRLLTHYLDLPTR
ncbi:hypothetical protein [Nocardia wallacei]|uniref:hypothetical protein n=1 Tax=Nocardia wallacei TaxID=480035 RepID=UPI0024589200|nr:hypothetical protein [Nocardia wallacei]